MQPTQLCQLATDYRGDTPPGGWLTQVKVDGWRCLYIRDWQGKPGLFTRNGHRIEGTAHILHRCAEIERAAGQPLMLDGEFQIGGSLAYTKRWCEAGWKQGGEAGQMLLFDAVPLADWQAGHCPIPLTQRLDMLRGAIEGADKDAWTWRAGSRGRDAKMPPVVMLDHAWAFDRRDVLEQAERVWAAGGEGVVAKDPMAGYERRRSMAWQKVKPGGPWERAIGEIRRAYA